MIFKKIKEIISKDGVVHFRRWSILKTPWFSINLHGIYCKDEDKHLHSHPFDFFNIVLYGSYVEELPGGKMNIRFPLNFAKRKGESYHKIHSLLGSKVVYTFNIMWNRKHTWGYNVGGKFIDHETYRELKRKNKI